MRLLEKKISKMEEVVSFSVDPEERTTFGIVSVKGELIRSISKQGGEFVEVDSKPDVYIAEKLEPLLTRPKRFNIVIGGRGSGKSIGIADIDLAHMRDEQAKVMCLREFQNSLEDSTYAVLKEEVDRLSFDGFSFQNTSIAHGLGGVAKFKGLARNPDSVKSAHGFKRFTIEESQFISANSLKTLTPTARQKPKPGLPGVVEYDEDEVDLSEVQMTFIANPGSSQDAFSQRFIVPFEGHLQKYGIYEDDLHLVIKMNHSDNPWYYQSGLESERRYDFENLPRALYDHIWEGDFNDSIENAIIPAEWFDACIDAHLCPGREWKARGVEAVFHDPSDLGDDPKGLAHRHGSVFLNVLERDNGDVNEGADWACDYAISVNADIFGWDVGGMGVSLKRQIGQSFDGKKTQLVMFNGADGVDNPDAIYQPVAQGDFKKAKKNNEVFKNKRAQYYWHLRDRVYKTYRFVVHKEYIDPDEMISFCSTIENMAKLRAEICRIPLKPNGNGFIQIMTKEEMKKLGVPSPNMADSVMMALSEVNVITRNKRKVSAPAQRRTMR